jgi:osmotically-inducible protein OsmY
MTNRRATRLNPIPADHGGSSVADAAQRMLYGSQYLALRRVTCTYHDGRLVLHGRAPSFYLVQLAQALVCRLPGVEQVENRIQVTSPSTHEEPRVPDHDPAPRKERRFTGRAWDEALSLVGPARP